MSVNFSLRTLLKLKTIPRNVVVPVVVSNSDHGMPHDTNASQSGVSDDKSSTSDNKTMGRIDESLHEETKQDTHKSYQYVPKLFDVWAMGVTTVIGGSYYGWSEGLSAGFGSYCIGQILMGFAYIILVLCLAEMIATTSFSGGAYGMARVVLGFYPGFTYRG
jgi:hypothetical protein